MKIILQDNKTFVLRFDKGEEVFSGLQKFMQDQQISACVFKGIGACVEAELAYYNEHLKDYRKKPFYENMEIVSLIGNGGLMEGKPIIHAHGVLGRTDFSIVGGHFTKIMVSPTCEIFLTVLNGALQREKNADFNLNLLV